MTKQPDKLFEQWMETRFEQQFFTDSGKDATRELWKGFLRSDTAALEKIDLSANTLGEKNAARALSSVGLFRAPPKVERPKTEPTPVPGVNREPGKK